MSQLILIIGLVVVKGPTNYLFIPEHKDWSWLQDKGSALGQPNIIVPLLQAGFGGPHHSEKDVFVDDFKIPAGTDVYPDVAGILRNSTYWENSDDFLPERFMEDQTNKHWIPFQIGGRSCPSKVILYEVVRCF